MMFGSLYFFTEIPRGLRCNYMKKNEIEDDSGDLVRQPGETNEHFRQRRREHPDQAAAEREEEFADEAIVNSFVARGCDLAHVTEEERRALERSKPPMAGVVVCLWIFLIHFNGFAVQETITTPLVTDIKHVSAFI